MLHAILHACQRACGRQPSANEQLRRRSNYWARPADLRIHRPLQKLHACSILAAIRLLPIGAPKTEAQECSSTGWLEARRGGEERLPFQHQSGEGTAMSQQPLVRQRAGQGTPTVMLISGPRRRTSHKDPQPWTRATINRHCQARHGGRGPSRPAAPRSDSRQSADLQTPLYNPPRAAPCARPERAGEG